MLEYYGWARIVGPSDDSKDENKKENLIFDSIKNKIELIKQDHMVLEAKYINGSAKIWAAGDTNHKGEDWYDILSLFKLLAELDHNSYGVIYVWDDEDQNGMHDIFQVYIIKNGKLTLHCDPFLSPVSEHIDNQ